MLICITDSNHSFRRRNPLFAYDTVTREYFFLYRMTESQLLVKCPPGTGNDIRKIML